MLQAALMDRQILWVDGKNLPQRVLGVNVKTTPNDVLGNTELSIQLLFEMMGHDSPDEDANSLEEDLVAVLQVFEFLYIMIYMSSVLKALDTPFVIDLYEMKPL
ncbi:hypothetical protein P691DRAFT_780729 [Macrolepiota fuliginosa MF-IS2]|uniref:Uncharacterized protein n=1 Tax=Macrolepiota fuliginosa MF-IS2 TaxID=1400762 RepID=A0A9P5WYW5_9AGAR|nr:hypothetical protein P691DRAFT_780729 [Macrolepiota fuliginosa MF-IS2]